jgi:hypothetical protein
MRLVTYLVSFKFSLLLVSYFCMMPRFKGDYSAINWRQFNRFSLSFLVLPFPTMLFACGYFLYTEGLWSYTSFAAIEVIIISSLAAALILLDAISAFRCKAPAGSKQDGNKVVTGADYESEDDDEGKRIRKNKKW